MRPFALLDQKASTEERILAAVALLDPRKSDKRVAFQCPRCGARGRTAFAYLNNESGYWRCNRLNECGASGSLWSRPSFVPLPSAPVRKPTPAIDPRRYERVLRAGRDRFSSQAGAYLIGRLPGFDPSGLDELAAQSGGYDLSRLQPKDLKALGVLGLLHGYGLVLGLRALDSGELVAFQGRALRAMPKDRPKILSSKGGYGEAGACFGSLNEALNEADSLGRLIVVEGLVDFLTARAAGVKGLVGVPGVGLAKKLAKELVSRGWEGRLLVSLDGDDAGAKGLAEIAKALENSLVDLATGRPESGDINDVWCKAAKRGKSGAEAVRAHFKDALDRMDFDPLHALPKVSLTYKGKMRARALFDRNRSETHSALRSLGTTGTCGKLSKNKYGISSINEMGRTKRIGATVCERQSCSWCRRHGWEQRVRHASEHWPEEMAMAKVQVSDKKALERLRAGLSKSGRKAASEEGNGYLTAIDSANGVLVVLATFELAALLSAKVGEFESVSRNQALCALAPCFVGASIRAAEKLNDLSQGLEEVEADEWVSRVLRWAAPVGKAFSFPKSKVMREAVRAEAKIQAEERRQAKSGAKEESESKLPEAESEPAPYGSIDVYGYWEGVELRALTLTPLSISGRVDVLQGRSVSGLDPDDPGNLLDNPDIAGPVVGDWVRRFYRHHAGKELEPKGRGVDRPPKVDSWSESRRLRLRAPLEKLRWVLGG